MVQKCIFSSKLLVIIGIIFFKKDQCTMLPNDGFENGAFCGVYLLEKNTMINKKLSLIPVYEPQYIVFICTK